MNQNLNFRIPAVDQLCAAVIEATQKLGGPHEFFKKLGEDSRRFSDQFSRSEPWLRSVLVRCVDDLNFRERVLSGISNQPDRESLKVFLEAWDVWKELEPEDHNWLRLALVGAPVEELLKSIPYRSNEVFRCTSALQLDAYHEDLLVKSAIQLSSPNKDLGGEGVLVLSGAIGSYIESVRLILQSLLLAKRELDLFRVPKEAKIIERIMRELGELAQVVERLREQFQKMVVDRDGR
ncbi:MAG TPA: hypothetical protein VM755_07050 [Stellaceae bacterium]|nr:hypothetical protein [Stellaceae bacterium]